MSKISFFQRFIVILALFPTVILSSCDDDDDTTMPTAPTTIVSVASGDADFTYLVAALQKAELVTTLEGTGPYTVFAPNNDAFIAAGFATEADVTAADKAMLEAILLNHVISRNVVSADLTDRMATGSLRTVGAGTSSNFYFAVNTDGIWVNEAKIIQPDLITDNGVIHVIDRVLTTGTVADLVINNPNFSTLEVGVTTAPTSLATTLSGAGTFTVFAPDNDAFDTFIAETNTDLTTLDSDAFNGIILAHALTSKVYLDGIPGDSIEEATELTANQQTLTFDGTAGFKDPNGRDILIVKTNIELSNGVVHVIDNVILPNN